MQKQEGYEEIPNGYKLTVQGTRNGVAYTWGYTALYDGRPHPVTGRDDFDAITAYKVDQYITLGNFTKAGIDVAGYQRGGNAAGTALKVIASGKRLDGSTYFDVMQYTS